MYLNLSNGPWNSLEFLSIPPRDKSHLETGATSGPSHLWTKLCFILAFLITLVTPEAVDPAVSAQDGARITYQPYCKSQVSRNEIAALFDLVVTLSMHYVLSKYLLKVSVNRNLVAWEQLLWFFFFSLHVHQTARRCSLEHQSESLMLRLPCLAVSLLLWQ